MPADGAASTSSVPAGSNRRRRRVCGPACLTCFYCGESITDPSDHEHDHFPLPYRHGGTDTVPSCRRCHSLKDRTGLHRWPPAALEAAVAGAPQAPAVVFFANAISDNPMPIGDIDAFADSIRRLIDSCTTPEARIVMAQATAFMLDREKRDREEEAA